MSGRKTVLLILVMFLLLPLVQAFSFDKIISKILYPENSVVGRAYVNLLKCRRYEDMVKSTEDLIEQACGINTPRMVYECRQYQELLTHYQGYLESYCASKKCDDGKKRCRLSKTGDTEWLQLCLDGQWTNLHYCYAGCESDQCKPEQYLIRVSAHPSEVEQYRGSLIVVDLHHYDGTPIPDARVKVGTQGGIFVTESGFTDEYGQAIFQWMAFEPDYYLVTAATTIGDVHLRDFTYVHVIQ